MEVCNMNVNTKTMVSISEANQNFSKVARLVDLIYIFFALKTSLAFFLGCFRLFPFLFSAYNPHICELK